MNWNTATKDQKDRKNYMKRERYRIRVGYYERLAIKEQIKKENLELKNKELKLKKEISKQKKLKRRRVEKKLYKIRHKVELAEKRKARFISDPIFAEKERMKKRIYENKARSELRDTYILKLLGKRENIIIHQSLIDLQKAYLMLKRETNKIAG